jgi:hypothetical protein
VEKKKVVDPVFGIPEHVFENLLTKGTPSLPFSKEKEGNSTEVELLYEKFLTLFEKIFGKQFLE